MGGTNHSDLGPPTPIFSQENVPQAYLVGHFSLKVHPSEVTQVDKKLDNTEALPQI